MKISPKIQQEIESVASALELFGLSWSHFAQFITAPFFSDKTTPLEDGAIVYPRRTSRYAYLAHKMGDGVEANTLSVLEICRRMSKPYTEVSKMRFPFPIYLVALKYLNDAVPEQKELGIRIDRLFFLLHAFDELWLCGPKISDGMKGEIQLAYELGILIRCYNPALQPELDKILSKLEKPV